MRTDPTTLPARALVVLFLTACSSAAPAGPAPAGPAPEDAAAPSTDAAADAPVADSGACPDVPTAVFQSTCVTTGCHSAKDHVQGLDLQSPNLPTRLVGIPAAGGPGLLVDPASPAKSVLYTKLSLVPPFGDPMPPTGQLSTATKACVLAWVEVTAAGAPADAGSDGAK